MPTDLPPEFQGTKNPALFRQPLDPALVSPHRLASEPKREPLLAGQPLGLQILRVVALVSVTAAIVCVGAFVAVAAVVGLIWLIP